MEVLALKIEQHLGEGAMGSVFLARDTGGQAHALKVLHTRSPDLLSLFEHEVELLAKLKHPRLVQVEGFSATGSSIQGIEPGPCFWMEFISGRPLLEAAKQASNSQVTQWFQESLEALEYLHRQEILHGDIKPANILVNEQDHIKLVDFGLAGFVNEVDVAAGKARGSIPYMAPEVLDGQSSPASDLYSLGTLFYQAFAGVHPRAKAKNLRELFDPKTPPLLKQNPELPKALARVIERLIEPNLSKRLKTTLDIQKALASDDITTPPQEESFHSFQMFGIGPKWQQALEFLDQSIKAHSPGIILIHGLAGVGKTRFLTELGFELALKGNTVLTGRPGPQDLIPANTQPIPGQAPPENFPMQIIHGAEQLSPKQLRPLYTFLRSPESCGILILEINDEYLSDFHKNFYLTLGLEKNICDIELVNLDRRDTESFLHFCLRPDLPNSWTRDIYGRTAGNPKLLTETCKEILASGILNKKHLGGESLAELALPQTAHELFQRRLTQLTGEQENLLIHLALNSGPVELAHLVSVSKIPFKEIKTSLAALGHLGLIQSENDTGALLFNISHPTLSGLVTESLSLKDKTEIHRAWFSHYLAIVKGPSKHHESHVLALAWHAVHLPELPELFSWIEKAGQWLIQRENPQQALSLYQLSLPQLNKGPEREVLLRLIINIHGRMGQFPESLKLLEQWYQEFGKNGSKLDEVKYHISAAVMLQNLGKLDQARSRFLKGIAAGDPNDSDQSPLLARAYSLLGLLDMQEDQFLSAEAHFNKALHLLPPKGIAIAEVFKHQALLAVHRNQWEAAQAHLDQAETMYGELQHDIGLFSIALERGNLALMLNKITEAQAAYQRAAEIAKKRNDEASLARVFQNLGVLACRQGHMDAALDLLEKAREILSLTGNPTEIGLNLLQLALASAAAGHFKKCDQILALTTKQSYPSKEFSLRQEKVNDLVYLYRHGQPPKSVPVPERQASKSPPPEWDMEQRLSFEYQHKPQPRSQIFIEILQAIHEKLSDVLKISFEERGDYRRWVLKETITLPEKISSLTIGTPTLKKGKGPMNILEKIAEITKAILATNEIDQVLISLMDAAMEISQAKHGFLLLKNEQAAKPIPGFEVKVARNMDQKEIESSSFSVSVSVLQEAMDTGAPLVTDNALQDSRFEKAESVHQMELKSICALPLRDTTGVIGALYLDHPYQTDIFQEADQSVLQMLADQAALALQKAQMIHQLKESNVVLSHTVEDQAQEITNLKREVVDQRVQLKHEYKDIIGQSPIMMEVLSLVDRVTETKVPVWVYGESGTGKEMIARALHFNSSRAKNPFVSENCSALPETLLESELFGHKRGAFTHADRDKKGLLEYSDKGTVFLDEIADMSLNMQAKMLRFLQEGEIRPLGSNKVLKLDVRVVSASNKDLQAMVQEEKFREDLYYRLNGVTVVLPPLRERLEDIPLLAQHFLKKISKEERRGDIEITPDALTLLLDYHWPGNVRELENTLRTAVLFQQKGKISAKSFNFKKTLGSPRPVRSTRADKKPENLAAPQPATKLNEEKRLLLQALFDSGYHKGHAAKTLGISRRYLYTQLLRHQVPVGRIEMKSYIESHLEL